MESQISPKNIEARVEAMAAAEKPEVKVETPAPDAKVDPKVEPKVDAKVEPKADEKIEPKVEPKVDAKVEPKVEPKVEKKQPNDPAELRKWATKSAQEASALRDEIKALKTAVEKLSKKPVDYAELAKNPDSLKAHIEAERQEAIRDLQQQLNEKNTLAVKNETMYERTIRERDKENYPRWEKLFPLIQTLANNGDGRINWNQKPGDALDEAYSLADQLSPSVAPAVVTPTPAAVVVPVTPAEKTLTQAEVDTLIAKAKADTRIEIESGLRNEANGAGTGSMGKGGKRDNNVSKEALKKMPLADLKKLIASE